MVIRSAEIVFEVSSGITYSQVRRAMADRAESSGPRDVRRGVDAAVGIVFSVAAAGMMACSVFRSVAPTTLETTFRECFFLLESLVPLAAVCLLSSTASKQKARFGMLCGALFSCLTLAAMGLVLGTRSTLISSRGYVRFSVETCLLLLFMGYVTVRCAVGWLVSGEATPDDVTPAPHPLSSGAAAASAPKAAPGRSGRELSAAVTDNFRWFVAHAQASAVFVVSLDLLSTGGVFTYTTLVCALAFAAIVPVLFSLIPRMPSAVTRWTLGCTAILAGVALFTVGILLPVIFLLVGWIKGTGWLAGLCSLGAVSDCAALALRTYLAISASVAANAYSAYCSFAAVAERPAFETIYKKKRRVQKW